MFKFNHVKTSYFLKSTLIISMIFYSGFSFSAEATTSKSSSVSVTYDNQDSRFSIKYPVDWIYDASERGAVVFSGKQNTPSYYSTVDIQTILTKKAGGEYANVDEFIADIKKQILRESPSANFLESTPITLNEPDGSKVKGQSLTYIYSYKGQVLEQWQIVVQRNDGKVFYAFAYTAPLDQYQVDVDIAKAMLKTWSIY